jgi:hypothetical protein
MNGGLVIEKEFDRQQSICSTQKNATGTKCSNVQLVNITKVPDVLQACWSASQHKSSSAL